MANQPRQARRTAGARAARAWPSGAYALAALGPLTAQVVHEVFREEGEFNLFSKLDREGDNLKRLAEILQGWADDQAAEVVTAYARALNERGREVDLNLLARWVLAHTDNAAAVLACLNVQPPEGITILRLLSRPESRKQVFLATWRLTQRQVVLKVPPEQPRLVTGPLPPTSPLATGHPNLIETHYLANERRQDFLVEERLPILLSDSSRAHGIQEAANLLFDIAQALHYLHRELGLAHGSVHPDHIGKKGDDYILLDFGLCRPITQVAGGPPWGCLATRAPECLDPARCPEPAKADVWALGATVFHSLTGRYPLLNPGEAVADECDTEGTTAFTQELRRRAQHEWDRRVDRNAIPEPLRGVLTRALEREPQARATAEQILDLAERELPAFLRHRSRGGRFSALDELYQFLTYLPRGNALELMPITERQALRGRLEWLRETPGVRPEDKLRLEELLARVMG